MSKTDLAPQHEKLHYLEFPAKDLDATKHFFEQVFNWSFTDYGPDYSAFSDSGMEGGFYRAALQARTEEGSALVVFYSEHLEITAEKIRTAGGDISKAIFEFPGGRRFHFIEPSGNEMAVWSALF